MTALVSSAVVVNGVKYTANDILLMNKGVTNDNEMCAVMAWERWVTTDGQEIGINGSMDKIYETMAPIAGHRG